MAVLPTGQIANVDGGADKVAIADGACDNRILGSGGADELTRACADGTLLGGTWGQLARVLDLLAE